MQGVKAQVTVYNSRDIITDIRARLSLFGPEALDYFREGPFGTFLQMQWSEAPVKAFHALMTR